MSMVARDTTTVTEHGILVPLGHFAEQVGLLGALERIPFEMKTVVDSPGDNLAEVICHICGGGMHLAELERSAHPLVDDPAVAAAWGQATFASATGVSALLARTTPPIVAAVRAELDAVVRPFRQRVLRQVTPGWIVVDLDLMGLVVSDQAATYEGADYGYMGQTGKLGKGYQFARAQLTTERERLVLGGFLHPGHTLSTHCVAELVGAIEATLGRPRRRVEVLGARLEALRTRVAALAAQLARWAKDGRPRRRQGEAEARLARLRGEVRDLEQRRAIAEEENRANPAPRRTILRLDAGFGTAEHLAWLYEQGYSVIAKVPRPTSRAVSRASRACAGRRSARMASSPRVPAPSSASAPLRCASSPASSGGATTARSTGRPWRRRRT